jgi:hypothetical protein
MPVPKTSMYKNYRLVFGQYNIRRPRQILYMQPVPKPVFMQKPAHQQFRLGILAVYARHVIAAGFFAVYIGHKAKVREIALAMGYRNELTIVSFFSTI